MPIPYQSGSQQVMNSYNYLDVMDIIRDERDPNLIRPFGRTVTGMAEFFGDSKSSTDLNYIHYERKRAHQKIKATAVTATVGNPVTFTLDADAINAFEFDAQPAFTAGTTAGDKGYPVKKNDVLMIKPASGVASNTMIYATVRSVNKSANTFVAYADGGTAIPNITPADEIVVLTNRMGEGGKLPDPTSFDTVKRNNTMNKMGYRTRITGTAEALGQWVTDTQWTAGSGISEHLEHAMYMRELQWLLGDKITNTTLTDLYGTVDEEPVFSGQGLFPEIWDRGNNFSYSSVTGPTLAYFKNIVNILDKQKSPRNSMLCVGLGLRSQISDLMRDQFQDGAVSYGIFDGSQDKSVSFDYDHFKLDNHQFSIKTVDLFNDVQTLGASGYPYPNEGFLMPNDKVVDLADNRMTTPMRVRHLENNGRNTSLYTTFYDGRTTDPDGRDIREWRFYSEGGIELFSAQHWGWMRSA